MTNEIQITPEIAGLAINNLPTDEISKARADINAFLKDKAGIDTDQLKASVAENTGNTINICLPYYSWIKENAEAVSDADMDVAGGSDKFATVRSNRFATRPEVLSHEHHTNNWHQMAFNARMFFTGQENRIDNDYNGDFDVNNNPTYLEGSGK